MISDGALLQFGGFLVAILLLAALAHWMGLGGRPHIESHDQAKKLAGEVSYGFDPVDCAIDADGAGAILADSNNRVLVMKRHGSHFSGRVLTAKSDAEASNGALEIDPGERRFGTVKLKLVDSEDWANRIKALRGARNA
ncbi:MAG TPA: hypothetical protein DCS24_08095 [Erythrobacter sp.]|nr:hypothetical protein [Erythrobacter sp.]